ncbi:Peroxidase 12 [Glycine soja]|nr:Peroxidase 12 [Glycine soja]
MMAGVSGSSTTPLLCSLFFISSLLFASCTHASSQAPPPIVDGLSWDFYRTSCPMLEGIVSKHLQKVFKKDNGQAPALLRIFFHDCFVQGCDGSILLDGSPNEKDQPANIGIRPEALQTIENLRSLVHKQCGRVVSCADLVVLAARDAVSLSGGPIFPVPLGRKDGLTFSIDGTGNLPGPSSRTGQLPAVLDVRTPNVFDNKYYVNLANRQGLFTSDQDLFGDARTKGIVNSFAENQKLFFEKFSNAVVKLSQLDVLTGKQGQIRAKCSVPNKKKVVTSVVEEEGVDLSAQM